MDGLLHLVQRGGNWVGWAPPSPLIAVPNVTAHPLTASVPITVLLYNGPLLCGFNVAIKGLTLLNVTLLDLTQFITYCDMIFCYIYYRFRN